MHTLPAGLKDNNGEFFVANGTPSLLTRGKVIDFDHFDAELKAAIIKTVFAEPEMVAAYRAMGAVTHDEIAKQGLICGWGGFDMKADIVNGELCEREAWLCPNRGTCAFEGIGCLSLSYPDGLTGRQIQLIRLTATGKLDKEIADILQISLHTVTSHNKIIRNKLGLKRKVDFTRYAHQNNLIS